MKLPFKVGMSPTLKIRGIVATRKIRKGEVVERCPVIVISNDQAKLLAPTILDNYVFEWDKNNSALVLGYGSIYNHSYARNVEVDFDYIEQEAFFSALREIARGEELLINYNDDSPEPVGAEYLDFDKKRS